MTRKHWYAMLALIVVGLMALPAVSQAKKGGNDDHNNNQKINGTYTFRMTSLKSFSAEAATVDVTDPAGLKGAPRQDILRVGVFTADGNGNITSGHTIATTDTNGGKTEVIDFTWTGTYSVNADGTGTLNINDPPPAAQKCKDSTAATPPTAAACAGDDEGAESYAIVVNRHGDQKTVDLTETDNGVGGGAKIFMTGQAKRSESQN